MSFKTVLQVWLPLYSAYERAALIAALTWATWFNGPLAVLCAFAGLSIMVAGHARMQVVPLAMACAGGALSMFPAILAKAEAGPAWLVTAWRVGVALAALLSVLLHRGMPIPTLPPSTGKYHVGVQDAWLSREGVRMRLRLMYPLAPTRSAEHPSYLLHGTNVIKGIAAYKRMWWPIVTSVLHTRVPFWRDVDGQPPPTDGPTPTPPPYTSPDGPADARRAPAAGHPALPAAGCPVLLFSHGLAAVPEVYSTLCAELVSHGWLVLMPEHCDGSAAYAQEDADGAGMHYVPLMAEEKEQVALEWKRRNLQLLDRSKDLGCLLELVAEWFQYPADVQAGRPTAEYEPSLDFLRYVVALHGDSKAVWLGGHSFGGATCIETAAQSEHPDVVAPALVPPGLDARERRKLVASQVALVAKRAKIAGVLALDPWTFPLSPSTLAHGLPHTPVLAMLGKQFSSPTELPMNYNALQLLLNGAAREAVVAAHSEGSGTHVAHVALGAELPDAAEETNEAGASAGSSAEGWREHICGVDARGFWRPSPELNLRLLPGVSPGTALLRLPGLQHLDFSDLPHLAPASALGNGTGGVVAPQLLAPWLGACIRQYYKHVMREAGPLRAAVPAGRTMAGGMTVPAYGGGGVRSVISDKPASAVLALAAVAKHEGLAPEAL